MPEFYITTAIDYVNGLPHMGHALEKVGADVLVRYQKARGDDTWFVIGSDEHSVSVLQAATEEGKSPEQFTDEMDVKWRQFWQRYQVGFDAYVRSTSEANRASTEEFMRRLHDRGHIYKGVYEGWYCDRCEQFYPEEELLPNGNCPEHPTHKPQWLEEENYFFRASTFEKQVRDLLERPDFLQPEGRRKEMLNAISKGLRDVSISRKFTRWGFPLPFDESQVVYVWFDALLCYVTGVGFGTDAKLFQRFWPCDLHVIGKGITRFHTLMWPAMLLAAGVELPRRVFSHGYINIGGERMSKSRGLFFDPALLADIFGSDGARYLLMREFPFDRDSDFELEQLVDRFNSDLANDLGNLVARTLTMVERYREGKVPASAERPVDLPLAQVLEAFDKHLQALAFDEGLKDAWQLVAWANRHIDESAPWSLARDPARTAELDAVLYRAAEVLRLLTHLLAPYVPSSMAELARRLGSRLDQDWKRATRWGGLKAGTAVETGAALFPRLDKEAVLAAAISRSS
ncbi:MAG TPA: methionine--tRNA ligase [Candidatus Acidoferrales bacterium]|nr:methionine--tRNA ligase [Candidatus Acidoferrales bacterium]